MLRRGVLILSETPNARTWIMIWALGPCPWPILIALSRDPNPESSANLSNAAVGSDPGESTNSNGATAEDSLYDLLRSNGGGSTNLWSITYMMHPRQMRNIVVLHNTFMIIPKYSAERIFTHTSECATPSTHTTQAQAAFRFIRQDTQTT